MEMKFAKTSSKMSQFEVMLVAFKQYGYYYACSSLRGAHTGSYGGHTHAAPMKIMLTKIKAKAKKTSWGIQKGKR